MKNTHFNREHWNTACEMCYDWGNGNGVSQSEFWCYCWEHELDEDVVTDFVYDHEEEHLMTQKNWDELLK